MCPSIAITLIHKLPERSRTVAHYRGGSHYQGWDTDRYLRAALIDSTNWNTYLLARINSKSKPKEPKPVETPDQHDAKKEAKKPENNPFAQRVFNELDKLKEQE